MTKSPVLCSFVKVYQKRVGKSGDYIILLTKSKKDAHASLEKNDKKKQIKAIAKYSFIILLFSRS